MENIKEIWKDVLGYEGLYQINKLGEIKRLSRYAERKNGSTMLLKEKIFTGCDNGVGYLATVLSFEGKTKRKYIHRLVAEAFIPNPDKKEFINHIDGDKMNNMLYNLEWCTCLENNRHAFEIGLQKKGKEHHLFGKKGELCHNHKNYKPIKEEPKPIY